MTNPTNPMLEVCVVDGAELLADKMCPVCGRQYIQPLVDQDTVWEKAQEAAREATSAANNDRPIDPLRYDSNES